MKGILNSLCVIVAVSMVGLWGTTCVQADYTAHSPIRIDSNSDFDANHGVTGGNGTEANPWIIENYDINGTGYGYCLYIGNTTDYFEVSYCYFHDASGNSGTYHWNSGLVLYNVTNGVIKDNVAWDNSGYGGILLKDSYDNTIEHNYAYSNLRGLNVYGSDDNTIIYNNFSSNTVAGIYMINSDDNTIANSIIGYNDLLGIWLISSSSNIINDSIMNSNTQRGILLHGFSSSNTVKNNTLNSNGYGVYIFSSASDNTIYHNNLNNTNQAQDNGNDNAWDNGYPSGGNYWSDYNGVDNYSGPGQNESGSDGIGDTPYSFNYAQDDYPLMESAETEGLGIQEEPESLGIQEEPE